MRSGAWSLGIMVKDRELPEVTIGHQSYVRATPAQPFSVVIKYNGTVGMWRVAITIDGKDTGFQKIDATGEILPLSSKTHVLQGWSHGDSQRRFVFQASTTYPVHLTQPQF